MCLVVGGSEFFARPILRNRSVSQAGSSCSKNPQPSLEVPFDGKSAWGRQERRDLPIWKNKLAAAGCCC
jgi:hypothetical protein